MKIIVGTRYKRALAGTIYASEGDTKEALTEFGNAGLNVVINKTANKAVKKLATSKRSETIISATVDLWIKVGLFMMTTPPLALVYDE